MYKNYKNFHENKNVLHYYAITLLYAKWLIDLIGSAFLAFQKETNFALVYTYNYLQLCVTYF